MLCQDILRCSLMTIGSVVAAHSSPQLEVLTHGLMLGRHISDLLYNFLQNNQHHHQQQSSNISSNDRKHTANTSGLARLAHVFDRGGRGHSNDETVKLVTSNDESAMSMSQDQVLRTSTDLVGTLAGFSVAYISGVLVSTYTSCAIGAELITDSLLTLASEYLLDSDSNSDSSEVSSIFTGFFVKLGLVSTEHPSTKEKKSRIPPSVQAIIRQYLRSPTTSFVLKSVLITIGLSRVPFHRATFLENALLSPLLLIERLLQVGLVFVKPE